MNYYLKNDKERPRNPALKALTRIQMEIINTISDVRGITQKQLAKQLGESKQTISYNVKQLRGKNIIQVKKHGRTTRCHIE